MQQPSPHLVTTVPFSVEQCTGYVQRVTLSDVIVEGKLHSSIKDGVLSYVGAAPADMRASFTGSGLPFTSPDMALQGTPNKGAVRIDSSGSFKITLKMPNSYYAAHGTVLVPPTLYLVFDDETVHSERTVAIQLEEPIPYRTLTYPNGRTSAMFYDRNLPVRSQEQILRDSAYPINSTLVPESHWGLKPPF